MLLDLYFGVSYTSAVGFGDPGLPRLFWYYNRAHWHRNPRRNPAKQGFRVRQISWKSRSPPNPYLPSLRKNQAQAQRLNYISPDAEDLARVHISATRSPLWLGPGTGL